MFRKIFDFLNEYLDLEFLAIVLFCIIGLIITLKVIDFRIWELWYVQSNIILEEHGRVFESELDWKLYKLEKLGGSL